jgi:uncharacterized protein (DUF983 family)
MPSRLWRKSALCLVHGGRMLAAMDDRHLHVSPWSAGLACRCPRCGRGALFVQPFSLRLRERCEACGLNYAFVDTGDGPAVFAILILGFVVLGLAVIVEFKLAPPLWVHIVLWTPVTLLLAFGLLRPLKATLIALQFKHKAEEGRLADDR